MNNERFERILCYNNLEFQLQEYYGGQVKTDRREFISKTCKCLAYCAIPSALLTIQGCEDNVDSYDSTGDDTGNNDSDSDGSGGSGGGNTSNSISFNLDEQPYSDLKVVGNSIVTSGNKIDNVGLLLYRKSENEILAFTRRCTHAGYEIGAFSGGVSVCSSGHGGRFDTNGKAVSRPATGSLRQYQAVLSGSTLTIS